MYVCWTACAAQLAAALTPVDMPLASDSLCFKGLAFDQDNRIGFDSNFDQGIELLCSLHYMAVEPLIVACWR